MKKGELNFHALRPISKVEKLKFLHFRSQNKMTSDLKDEVYNGSFTEVDSVSDLKSVPSASAVATEANSPIQTSNSESEPEFELDREKKRNIFWSKYKRFRDPITGEEAVYELVEPVYFNKSKGLLTLCSELVTLSSISLFVASNLFAFTVGILVGKRMAYEF